MAEAQSGGQPTESGPSKKMLGTLFLVVFVDLIGFGIVIPILPLYAERYEPSALVFGLLMASFSAMQFLFAPLFGRLSDRVGRRPVLVISMLGAAAGYVLFAFADSIAWLFASRIIAGICGANIPTAQAVVADVTGPAGRSRAMGMIGAAFGLGFIFGPALSGVLLRFGEMAPGFGAAAMSLLAAILVIALVPETLRRDSASAARPPLSFAALGHALRTPLLGFCLLLILLVIFAFSGFETTFAQVLCARYGMTVENVPWLLVYVGVLAAIVQGGLVGRLSKRFGEVRLITAGTVLGGVGLLAIPFTSSLTMLLPVLALIAAGVGVTTPTLASLTSKLARAHEVGGVMGLYQSLSSLGRIFGPFAGEAVYGVAIVGPAWLSGVAMFVAAFVALVLLVRVRAVPIGEDVAPEEASA